MPLPYAQNKKHIYSWRAKVENREKYVEGIDTILNSYLNCY